MITLRRAVRPWMRAWPADATRVAPHRRSIHVELAHTGAVTFIQRFDSALRLNPHPHTLALDGVYVRGDDGQLDFHPLPAPSAEEVADVARRTAARVRQLLEQRAEEQDGAEPSGWTVCCAASAQGLSLFGPRAGQPPLRLVDPSQARPDEPIAIVSGFNVHAARTVPSTTWPRWRAHLHPRRDEPGAPPAASRPRRATLPCQRVPNADQAALAT